VLAHLYPEADIPVVQLSVDASKAPSYHFDLGRRLAPLRDQGVLIVASGNVVHNLGGIDWSKPDAGFDWARRFDGAARAAMTGDPASALSLERHSDYAAAAPTPDHFLPLLYLAGLADAASEAASTVVEGYTYGSLSMTAYALGVSSPA
jgi:4,5-DOPA dioxygenase extradiol